MPSHCRMTTQSTLTLEQLLVACWAALLCCWPSLSDWYVHQANLSHSSLHTKTHVALYWKRSSTSAFGNVASRHCSLGPLSTLRLVLLPRLKPTRLRFILWLKLSTGRAPSFLTSEQVPPSQRLAYQLRPPVPLIQSHRRLTITTVTIQFQCDHRFQLRD